MPIAVIRNTDRKIIGSGTIVLNIRMISTYFPFEQLALRGNTKVSLKNFSRYGRRMVRAIPVLDIHSYGYFRIRYWPECNHISVFVIPSVRVGYTKFSGPCLGAN